MIKEDERTITPHGLALLYTGVQSCATPRAAGHLTGVMSIRISTSTPPSVVARPTSATSTDRPLSHGMRQLPVVPVEPSRLCPP